MEMGKRSGQIPAFGDWDYANELPITQYFESARQAGLIRYSSASGECDLRKPPLSHHSQGNGRGISASYSKEQKKQGKVCDVAAPPRKPAMSQVSGKQQNRGRKQGRQAPPPGRRSPPTKTKTSRPPKAVDEDLYKIPPELLHSSTRKKNWGIFSRCLVPNCMA